jgi:hypothetical protein
MGTPENYYLNEAARRLRAAQAVFSTIVRHVGVEYLNELCASAEESVRQGDEGISTVIEEDAYGPRIALDVRPGSFDFIFDGDGPYYLPMQHALPFLKEESVE